MEKDPIARLLIVLVLFSLACGGRGPTSPEVPDAPAPAAPAPRPEVWVVWGQSNALGCAEGPGYSGGPGVEAWGPTGWVPAEEPLPFMDPFSSAKLSCESGWAVKAANLSGRPIRLTGHAHVAKPVSWWLKDPGRLLSNLSDARDARWLIAYQGESDAERRSTTWVRDFSQLVALVRGATNPELRVLVVGLGDEPSTSGRNLWNNLRAQQRAYADGDPLSAYTSAEGLPTQEDEVHLTREGYSDLARRVAALAR